MSTRMATSVSASAARRAPRSDALRASISVRSTMAGHFIAVTGWGSLCQNCDPAVSPAAAKRPQRPGFEGLNPHVQEWHAGPLVANLSCFVHMSADEAVDSQTSESSSGYEDGVGRRVLAFDRETGAMLERLVLRPELAAFERALHDRMGAIAALEDERFTVPRAIERDADDRLIVVSECVAGRRLSDLIDAAADHGIVAGIDAGLGLLLELLPALSRLHDAGSSSSS